MTTWASFNRSLKWLIFLCLLPWKHIFKEWSIHWFIIVLSWISSILDLYTRNRYKTWYSSYFLVFYSYILQCYFIKINRSGSLVVNTILGIEFTKWYFIFSTSITFYYFYFLVKLISNFIFVIFKNFKSLVFFYK